LGQIARCQFGKNRPDPSTNGWKFTRNDTIYIIESHPSGGIPIASHPVGKPEEITYHLNDLLGTTLATIGPAGVNFSRLTSFGQPLKSSSGGSSLSPEAPSSPINPVPSTNQLPPTKR
jgi:hypothetical protein